MPIYEFDCTSCGPFEAIRAIHEASTPTLCPSCHSSAHRILSLPALLGIARTAQQRRMRSTPPYVVQRKTPETPPSAPSLRTQGRGRPWQLSH